MTDVQSITVQDEEGDVRLDRWFRRRFPALGHARLERLLRTGQVRVDGRRAKSGTRLSAGQLVRVPPLAPADHGAASAPRRPAHRIGADEAAALRQAVLYRDDWVIALNKPPGLAVQGGSGQSRSLDAMAEALRDGAGDTPRLVHRLDKDTSGVLLMARGVKAAAGLSAAFRRRDATKFYWALVVGAPAQARGLVDLALAKRPGRAGDKVAAAEAAEGGKAAQTLYRVVETSRRAGKSGPALSWLLLMPLTGRTHQVRAHCAALGTPIAGDGKYGGNRAFPEALAARLGKDEAGRLMLHAREIALPHPDDGTTLRVTAPLPAHMEAAWRALGFDARKAERAARELLDYAEGVAHSPPGTAPGRGRRQRATR